MEKLQSMIIYSRYVNQDRSIEGITFVELGGVEKRVDGHSTLS